MCRSAHLPLHLLIALLKSILHVMRFIHFKSKIQWFFISLPIGKTVTTISFRILSFSQYFSYPWVVNQPLCPTCSPGKVKIIFSLYRFPFSGHMECNYTTRGLRGSLLSPWIMFVTLVHDMACISSLVLFYYWILLRYIWLCHVLSTYSPTDGQLACLGLLGITWLWAFMCKHLCDVFLHFSWVYTL